MKTFVIPQIITDQDLIKFQERVGKFVQDKQIVTQAYSVNIMPVPGPNGKLAGIVSIPSVYIEYMASEQEYREWKFNEKLLQP